MTPTAYDVAAYLGRSTVPSDLLEKLEAHLAASTAMVKAYTRGKGFETGVPNAELEQVIVTTTARSIDNPTNLRGQGIDDATVQYQIVSGWTLAELAVLNRYRKRAL